MNPLLSREIRARWRDGRAFILVFMLAALLTVLFVWTYSDNLAAAAADPTLGRWALLGHSLFAQLAWIQTLGWLLVAPALTSSAISYERERGWFDALILSPLLPRQISVGKWGGALLYAGLLYLVALPFTTLTLLLGGVAPEQFWLITSLHTLCACYGAAMGLATSSWSYRSNVALRSAYGLILIWLIGSFAGATWSGRTPVSRLASLMGGKAPAFWEILGRTNPVLCANDISSSTAIQNWPFCFMLLGCGTLFFLAITTYFARRTLEEAPFVEVKRRRKKGAPLASHGEIPLVSSLSFGNPVFNRELHSKFRMRQPPLVVILVEALLGLLVAGFYLRTLYWAWSGTGSRPTIWFGLIITGMIVTMMASAVMGANGFSREREAGTWEGLRLSMLTSNEILGGKIGASILTCILFSAPVWPLLIPCVSWHGAGDTASVGNAFACALIWLSTISSFTMIGLWIGRKQTRSSRASGQTLGLLGAFIILSPFLMGFSDDSGWLLGATHPFIALGLAFDTSESKYFGLGLPYFAFNAVLGVLLWRQLNLAITKDLNRGD